jgi:hypothetical protein
VVAEVHIDGAIARDLEVEGAISTHQADPSAHHTRYTGDEAWGAVLDRDGPNSGLHADLLDGQHASAFASASHNHNHGTLTGLADDDHTQYFHLNQNETVSGRPAFIGGTSGSSPPFTVDSNYHVANLNVDYLDGYSATSFALSGHDHFGDYWSGSSTGYGLSVYNSTTGDGIRGYSYATSTAYGGLYGYNYSSGSGVVGSSSSGHGVHGSGATGIYGSGNTGVYGSGSTGVYGYSSNDGGQAVQGTGTGTYTEGVLGTSDQATGVYGIAGASTGTNAIGVWGQTNYTWGFYTGQSLYVGGSCVGCSTAYIAQSDDDQPLEVGDIVSISGIAPPLAGGQTPILTVKRASDTGQGLLGVVQSRAIVDAGQMLQPSENGLGQNEIEIPGTAPGRVTKGDYLFVVVQGMAQVRVDASDTAIEVGDAIGPAAGSGAGRMVDLNMAPAPVLGHALEALSDGTGLVWTLILGH